MTKTQSLTREYFDESIMNLKKNLESDTHKRLQAVEAGVQKNAKYLFGNGDSIGLDERVRNIEAKLSLLLKLAWGVVVPVGGWFAVKLFEALIGLL